MKFCSFSSGSKQNCFYLETEQTAVLIDAGISYKNLEKFMALQQRNLNRIEAIFITHEHGDHVRGLWGIQRKLNVPVFINKVSREKLSTGNFRVNIVDPMELDAGVVVKWKDLNVFPFMINHDAANTFGFKISDGKRILFIATDIGSFKDKIVNISKGAHMIAIEANYDVGMLQVSPYPDKLKKRIAGVNGHLSNRGCAEFLSETITEETKNVMFLHLSENNNHPTVVQGMVDNELEALYGHVKFHIAKRDRPGYLIEV